VAEAAVEPRMVRQRAVRPAVAVQSDVAAGSSAPRYRVDLVAAAEPAKAAHPVRAAALGAAAAGAVVPDALVVAVPAASVVVADAPVVAPVLAVAGAVVPDALAVAVVPAVPVVVEPDALVVAPVRRWRGRLCLTLLWLLLSLGCWRWLNLTLSSLLLPRR